MQVSHDWFVPFYSTYDWIKKGANILNQSCGVVSAKPITFQHLNENCFKK